MKPLTPAQAMAARMYIRGYTQAEIASATGTAPSTVHGRLQVARRRLGVSRLRMATLADVRAVLHAEEKSPVTRRQHQILMRSAEGMERSEIAEALALSPSTIKNHISAMLKKLEARNMNQAIAEGFRKGILR